MKFRKLIFTIIVFYPLNLSLVFAAEKEPITKLKENISDDVSDKKMVETEDGEIKKLVEDDKGVLTFVLENDLFVGNDSGYTNGAHVSYTSSEKGMPSYIKKSSNYIPLLNKNGEKRISISAGQNIYTPSDITKSEFQENDFLYAGWLYGSLGILSDNGNSFDNAVITLGVVGPSSRAEQAQKFIHHAVGSLRPKGWDHQLKDELGANFSYERKWRHIVEEKPFGIGVDIMPHVGANLGNVYTNAAFGTTFRFGYDLPADYGPPRIRPNLPGSDFFIPTKKLSGYLFTTAELRAVGRNIFLDGNSFQNGPSLDKRIMVKTLQYGATAVYNDVRISYTNILVSKEFKGQKHVTEFGAITLSCRF